MADESARPRTPPPGWDDPDPGYRIYLQRGGQALSWDMDHTDLVDIGRVSVKRFSPRFRFEPPEDDVPYTIEIVVENTLTGPECAELRLIRRPGTPPVTAKILREIHVADLVRWVASHQPVFNRPMENVWTLRAGNAGVDDVKELRSVTNRQASEGRQRIPDDDLRRVAEVYRQAIKDGRRDPVVAVLNEVRPLKSRPQAGRWIRKARERGFLEAAPGPRRAGERVAGEPPCEKQDVVAAPTVGL